jgi:hypothetical protein
MLICRKMNFRKNQWTRASLAYPRSRRFTPITTAESSVNCLELNRGQPAWKKGGNGSASRLLSDVLLHTTPEIAERWRRRLEKDFDKLMELDNYLDIIIQDLEQANPEVNGLLKHLYNVIKFQEPSDGYFTVVKIMGGIIGEFAQEGVVSVQYSQQMYGAVFGEMAGVRGRMRDQQGSQYLRAAGLADGQGCGFEFYASSLVLSSGRRGVGDAGGQGVPVGSTQAAAVVKDRSLMPLLLEQVTRGCVVLDNGAVGSVIDGEWLERNGVARSEWQYMAGKAVHTSLGTFLSGWMLPTLVVQAGTGQGDADQGVRASAVEHRVSVVWGLAGSTRFADGAPVEMILGLPIARQMAVGVRKDQMAQKFVVADGEEPMLQGCLEVGHHTAVGVRAFVGYEGLMEVQWRIGGEVLREGSEEYWEGAYDRGRVLAITFGLWGDAAGLNELVWWPRSFRQQAKLLEVLKGKVKGHHVLEWDVERPLQRREI